MVAVRTRGYDKKIYEKNEIYQQHIYLSRISRLPHCRITLLSAFLLSNIRGSKYQVILACKTITSIATLHHQLLLASWSYPWDNGAQMNESALIAYMLKQVQPS